MITPTDQRNAADKMQEMMEAYAKLGIPGAYHKMIESLHIGMVFFV